MLVTHCANSERSEHGSNSDSSHGYGNSCFQRSPMFALWVCSRKLNALLIMTGRQAWHTQVVKCRGHFFHGPVRW